MQTRLANTVSEPLADCNPHFDASLWGVWWSDAEAERGAFVDTSGHAKPHVMRGSNLSGTSTRGAPFTPHFAAPSAPRTRPPKRHTQRDEHAPKCFLWTDDDFSCEKRLAGVAKKRVAHPIEQTAHRREVNGDLVGKPLRSTVREQTRIVRSSAVRVAKDLVRARHFQERAAAVISGNVRMIPPRQLPVRALDFSRSRVR